MHLLGLLSALASAVVWGSGDFAGGLAARRNTQFQVVALASFSGLLALLLLAFARREAIPPISSIGWASLAGLCGAIGMAALYPGLASGRAAVVAPTAGVVGAALPVVVGFILEGAPGGVHVVGIAFGILGIWLVSRPASSNDGSAKGGLVLGVLAGLGFGGFFVLIAHVRTDLLFSPLVVAKLAALLAALVLLARRQQPLPRLAGNPVPLLAGVLDAGGNVLYLLATQLTRLDIAAVLASMYPAATVILSRVILHEHISTRQWLGVGLCLTGVGLIALR